MIPWHPSAAPAAAPTAAASPSPQVEEVVLPLPDQLAAQFKLQRDGCTGETFVAVYKSVKDAIAAVAKLHGQAAGGDGQQQAQQQGKKGKKAAAAAAGAGGAACRVWARQLSGEGLHQKRWRLVVRNLPFTASGAGRGTAALPNAGLTAQQRGSRLSCMRAPCPSADGWLCLRPCLGPDT